MDTNTPEDQPAPAEGRDGKRGHGAGVAAGVAIAFVLVALLALPGFLAAGFSRMKGDFPFCINDEICWDQLVFQGGNGVRARAEAAVLAPSVWVMRHWEAARPFYNRQYHAAGGVDVSITYEQ